MWLESSEERRGANPPPPSPGDHIEGVARSSPPGDEHSTLPVGTISPSYAVTSDGLICLMNLDPPL